jgi:carbon storage regulator CsrA
MLVLSRREGETVFCVYKDADGNEQRITVTVAGLRSNQVRLGFEAPRDVVIVRNEVPVSE